MQAELPLMYAQLVSLTTYGPGAEEVFTTGQIIHRGLLLSKTNEPSH